MPRSDENLSNRAPDDSRDESAGETEIYRRDGAPPKSAALTSGAQLGRYEIVDLLGRGGMGEVYRARDLRLNREVAVKVLAAHFSDDAQRLARFTREARAIAAVAHPNILVLYDVGDHAGQPFVVTELLDGADLRKTLEGGPMDWRRSLDIAINIAEGLAAAHDQGVIHRDLKPENIILTADGRTKILDFGLALFQPSPPSGDETQTASWLATQEGAVLGTIGYMSPQQVRGERVDPRTDVFSIGCVLFEMLNGRSPFRRSTAADTSAAILYEPPPPLNAAAPALLEALVHRCLSKTPDLRFDSADKLSAALRGVRETTADESSPAPVESAAPARIVAFDSLAVLPLANLTGGQELNYLSDGIAEMLINRLSKLSDVRVMAWSTVCRYRDADRDLQAIGDRLQVEALLAGRLVKQGEMIVVKMELVNAGDGAQLWGEHFEREDAELFQLEKDIAQQIAEAMQAQLSKIGSVMGRVHVPRDVQAYQHYLKGRFHWNRRNAEDLQAAIRHFGEAIAHDPEYAPAYAGLADSHGLLIAWGAARPREAFPIARQMAVQALELDSELAEAHASLGYISVVYEWDRPAAEQHYRRALQLNPGYATARHWLGYLLMLSRRFDEADAELRAAQQYDPLSAIIRANIGFNLFFAGSIERAITEYQRTIELDASLPSAHYYLGLAYEQLQQYPAAIESLRQSVALSGGVPGDLGALGHACARGGDPREAEEIIERLSKLAERNYVTSFNEGFIHLGLGRIERAFEVFEQALEERDFYLIYLDIDARLDPVRGDERFRQLRQRVGD